MEETDYYYKINLNDTTSLPLFQNFIRHYIGDKQYTDTYFLEVYDNKNNCIIRIINDELKLFMAGKKEIQHSSPNERYKVLIGYDYEYNFEYNNMIIEVILRIYKERNNIKISNIKSSSWNNKDEECLVYSNNVDFINELDYVFALKTPNLEHYHKNNERIRDRIMLLKLEDRDINADNFKQEYYVNYPVHQLTEKNIHNLNKLNYIASIKIDGIRTFVVITNNNIICYQKDVSFLYKHDIKINGNYIFDCELCNGELFLIDCFMYNGNNMKEIIFSERVNCMKEFANNYNIFNNQEHITINANELNYYTDISRFKKYFENPDFFKSFNLLKQLVLNSTFNYEKENYLDLLNQLKVNLKTDNQNFNNNDLLLSYVETLYDYIKINIKSNFLKNAYTQCINIIKNDYIHMYMILYSPIILITLLSYYYKIGYYDNESVYKKYAHQLVKDMYDSCKINLPHNSLIDLNESYKSCTDPKDGIIFTENSRMGQGMYIKWKPRDKLSADLKINLSDDITVNNSENYILGSLICYKNNKEIPYVFHNFLLNNFNKTLPMCENKDIVQSNNIVEVVPISKGNKQYDYKLLKVRYDKEKPNGITTVNNIFDQINNYINLF